MLVPKAYELVQGTKMERVAVTVLPKRSAATKVSIEPPRGKVRVDEKLPSGSWRRGAPFNESCAARAACPRTLTMPFGYGASCRGEAMKREGPDNRGHASMRPYMKMRESTKTMKCRVMRIRTNHPRSLQ